MYSQDLITHCIMVLHGKTNKPYVTSAVSEAVEVGNIGAIATSKYEVAPDGYYLAEFISTPYPEGNGIKCKVLWLEYIKGARKWFVKTEHEEVVDLTFVMDTNVLVNPVSPSNMLPSRVRKHVDPQIAVKISEDSHNFILDEIFRREALEYDPTMVIVGGEAENDEEE